MPLCWRCWALVTGCLSMAPLAAGEWSGELGGESRLFLAAPAHPGQANNTLSLHAEPEWYTAWDRDRQSVNISLFARWDERDSKRSHVDIRELNWLLARDVWELRAGIRKVFWGVTEIAHIVDIINQTDQVEDLNFEAKMGQPMLNAAWVTPSWGTLDVFVLPYFRERSFPGQQGRFRPALRIATGQAAYQSTDKQRHIDYALRWSHYLGDWDMALSHFYGTAREPLLRPIKLNGERVLQPFYQLIHQTGLELQGTLGSWLLKLEGMHRTTPDERFNAWTASLEYTFFDIAESGMDVGLLAEYMRDLRRGPVLLDNDLFIGSRLAWNNEQSSELLFGLTEDVNHHDRFVFIQGSHRLSAGWTLAVEGRIFYNAGPSQTGFDLRNDDVLQTNLDYHF